MNKNTRQLRARMKGGWEPRKSNQPKVARSAEAIMRKLGTSRRFRTVFMGTTTLNGDAPEATVPEDYLARPP
jgi:hypothetical protein